MRIGVLGPEPEKMLGINKLISDEGVIYYEVIKAIYYNYELKYAYLNSVNQKKIITLLWVMIATEL